MAPMRRGLVHAIAWTLSTGAAVTLSWWGVHTVMSGTAYDRPRALPINAGEDPTTQAKPRVSATHRPQPVPDVRPSKTSDTPGSRITEDTPRTPGGGGDSGGSGDGGKPDTPSGRPDGGSRPSSTSPTPVSSKPTGTVKGQTVDGGQVLFDVGPASAELLSATPNEGWRMDVYKETTFIRVVFTSDTREISVFCIWNGHPPRFDFDERKAP
ncbi:hypothetical protein [Streptomyces qinzhouensis]|uniref:Secreted protein n=1 Tax=Streptomyces qinzhouensis TaxID=2599401 RepID=A0A5B8J6M8_9ACTN|nr:hypothetical protein [Streptomyces qinzhouensis]QDY76866.1 hypothetical protein FQU76_10380 [Streptomyces qinzhouensis]